MLEEVSAGGVVARGAGVILVKVKNLQGEIVWTFPKGHLERGEGARQAALREVEEETGWSCRIKAPLMTARYRFWRRGREVSKRVRWYWMEPVEKVGGRDADEILAARWVGLAAAEKLLRYPSDLKLLKVFFGKVQA